MHRHNAVANVKHALLYDVVDRLGYLAHCRFLLDAADKRCTSTSGQWVNLGSETQTIYKGTSTGGDAAEPTFNGTSDGKSANEYFSFDGGDYFRFSSTNTWMQTWHKANAQYSIVFLFYGTGSATLATFLSTKNTAITANGIGVSMYTGLSGENIIIFTSNGSGVVNTTASTATCTANSWNFIGVSMNFAANAQIIQINNSVETFSGSMTSPTSSNYANAPCIFGTAQSTPTAMPPSGCRIAGMILFDVPVSQDNLSTMYHEIRKTRAYGF